MKKIVLLLALISYSAFNAQCADPIITNFECSPSSYTTTGALTSVANPFSSGINTSANVGQYTDDGTAAFDNLLFNKGASIDFSTNNILKFKIYSTKIVPLTVKLEGGTTSSAIEIHRTINVVNSWVEYTVDFSGQSTADHQKLIFFFNFNKTDGTATDTYYIDDIRWETATTSSDPIVTDFESTKPSHGGFSTKLTTVSNHISSGINKSSYIGKYKDDGTNGFDGLIFDYGTAIDLSTNNILKIKLYTPTSIQILAKLEGGTTAREISSSFSIQKGPVNSWIEFTYDFSAYANNASGGDGNTRIVFFINAGVTSGTSSDIYYIDDITWTPKSTWTGATNTNWSDAGNWTGGIPTATSQVEIPSGTSNNPIIGASTGALADNINTNDVLTIASGGSLIVGGASSGNVTYNRELDFTAGNLEGWHLVSAPVAGQVFNDAYVTANDIANNGTNRGIATYNNAVASNNWVYHQGGASSTFATGKGYSVKRGTSTGNISFTGTVNTSDINSAITVGTGTAFNLIGNPYTAYINSELLLSTNTALLDSQTIWIWNPTTKNYDAKVTSDTFKVSPGQGFFVKATSNGNFAIAKSTQSHETDTFLKSSKSEITLNITDGDLVRYAKVNYNNNASLGFDNGYDGETFSGVPNNLDVYTQLLSNNQNKNYQIQALPNSNLESMIIPVGLNSDAGKKITFSANVANLPSDIKVFLEDRNTNTFTRLDEANSKYTVTLTSAANGIGQFYLHTSKSALNIKKVNLNNVSVYTTDKFTLKIVGLAQGKTDIKLFNILGKQVLNTTSKTNGIQEISLPKLASGIYIVQVENEAGKLNKKIIL